MLLPVGFLSSGAPPPIDVVVAHLPPVTASLLLDTITAVVAGAYGLRRLRAAYAGPAVRVRRSNDNAEQDIGFASGVLDTAALLAFCGSGDGFISKWYDQSDAGQDVGQVAATQQPQIVGAGALVTLPGDTARPAILTVASATQCLVNPAFALGGAAYAAMSVASRVPNVSVGYARLLSYAAPGLADYESKACVIFGYFGGGRLHAYQSGDVSTMDLGTTPAQVASVWDGVSCVLSIDGVPSAPGPASGVLAPLGTLGVGVGDTNQSWDGCMAEHLILSGPLSAADQATIRASQQTFYGTP